MLFFRPLTLLKGFLQKHKKLSQLALGIYKPYRVITAKLKIKYRIISRFTYADDPYKLIFVNPREISETALNYKNEPVLRTIGFIRGGDWDRNRTPVDDMALYKALKLHFTNGTPLNQVPFFYNPTINSQELHDAQEKSWEYISAYEYEERSSRIDRLYNSILVDGYKSQPELGGEIGDEIKIKISREGHLLFLDGIHRLSIAKILGVDQVPIIVHTRHSEWHAFKKELFSYASRQQQGTPHQGKLYQKLIHPDLQDIPYSHECFDRFHAITSHINKKDVTVLDVGAYLGFFCFQLEKAGYDCTAIEADPLLFFFMSKLKQAGRFRTTIIQGDVLNHFFGNVHFDIVLALNVFHHFLGTKCSYLNLLKLLQNLRPSEMFFEPHNPHELLGKTNYINPSNDEFVDIVMQNTGLTNCAAILDCIEGRKLFHLWR